MTPKQIAVIEECTTASDAGRKSFPEVVGALIGAGVERYHADLIRAEKIYYLAGGESQAVGCAAIAGAPARTFTASGVVDAIRAIQQRAIDYSSFCHRIAAAGCVGYHVSMPGRRAVYYGRTGETHVEHFP